jgi:hypothetical protein
MTGLAQTLPLTPENEDKVATWKVSDWLAAGYNPSQIASMWNSGNPDWEGRTGVNAHGNAYNVPEHEANFETAYYSHVQSPDLISSITLPAAGTRGREYSTVLSSNSIRTRNITTRL